MKNNAVVGNSVNRLAAAWAVVTSSFTFLGALCFQLFNGYPVDSSGGFAAITWNFAGVTAEFTGLGDAVAAGIALAIGAGLVVWGLIRGFKPMLRVLGRLLG